VNVYVASAHEDISGTWIKENVNMIEEKSISGVSVSENVMLINIRQLPSKSKILADLFIRLAENEINVDIISQTLNHDGTMDVSFTTSLDDMALVNEVLNQLQTNHPLSTIVLDEDCVKVSVVGIGMRTQTGVAAKLFGLLSENDIDFKLVTTSEISISYTIAKKDKEKTVKLIAKRFNL
jgi:aspartate kinase